MATFTRELFIQTISARLEEVLFFMREQIKEEFTKQGHSLTGALEDTISIIITQLGTKVIGEMWVNDYYKFVDQGVSADRIPFSGATGAGGTSKYIQALVEYAKVRMSISDDKEALSVAFAIAHTHKKEGMPSVASSAFSSTGERKGFFTETLKESNGEIDARFAGIFNGITETIVASLNSRISGNVNIQL